MQDKNFNQQWDQDFEEFAWQSMRKKLDAEMPVQKKKRRAFFWFWFGSAALVCFTLASFFVYLYLNEDLTIKKDSPIVQTKQPTTSTDLDKNNTIFNNPITKEEFNTNKNNNNTTTIQKHKLTKLNVFNNNKNTNIVFTKKQTPLTNTPTITIPSNERNQASEKSVQPLVNNAQRDNTTQQIFTAQKLKINSLPNFSLRLLTADKEQKDLIFCATQPLSNNKKAKLKWGLTAAIKADEFLGKNTFSIGLTGEYSFAPRWYLQTGMSYGYKIGNNIFNGKLKDEEILFPDQTDFDSIGSFANSLQFDQQNAYTVLSNEGQFHILSLPLSLAYRISPKFSFSLGAELNYLLKGRTKYNYKLSMNNTIFSANDFEITKAAKFEDELFIAAINENFVKRWHLMGTAEFNFHPNKKLKLGLQYQYLISQPALVVASKKSLLENGLRLSLSYYFK